MKLWLVEPRDPLIFRDGKSFGATPGARAVTLPFPYPSTLAGAIRTRAGWTSRGFDTTRIEELRHLAVRGPFLVELTQEGAFKGWLFPAPADALLLKSKKGTIARRLWLRPVRFPGEVQTEMPDDLLPVSANPAVTEKPYPIPPKFWEWKHLQEWLLEPKEENVFPDTLGITGLSREERMHVSIDPDGESALEKHLFQTVGLNFVQATKEGKVDFGNTRFFALAVATEADIRPGIDFLGGERRTVEWRLAETTFPAPAAGLKEAITKTGYARLVLMTPGYFQQGYLPTWLKAEFTGLTILATAIPQRAQAISGWDFEKSRPKPSRRLVPAGSVYFLKIGGAGKAREDFVERFWFESICDAEQDRLDGFGISLLGAWDGRVNKLEVKDHA